MLTLPSCPVALAGFIPSPPSPLDVCLDKYLRIFSTEVLSVTVHGGCCSQGFHGYLLGLLAAHFGFTGYLPHAHVFLMGLKGEKLSVC